MNTSLRSYCLFFLIVTLTACGGSGGGKNKLTPKSSVGTSNSSVASSIGGNSSAETSSSAMNNNSSLTSSNSSSVVATTLVLSAEANVANVNLDWNAADGQTYTLYIATSDDCEIQTFESCTDKLDTVVNVTPGNQQLENGKTYWFQLQSSDNTISNKVFARPDQIVVNNVNAIVTDQNGTTYLGGNFDLVGLKTGYAALIDNNAGTHKPFPYVNGPVYVSVSDGTGGFYIGGNFTSVGEKPREGLAHILSDGSVADWNPSVTNGSIYALALTANSLYVGGEFQSINQGDSEANIAVLDLTNGNVTNRDFSTNERIRTLVIANNHLFIGGDFTEVNGETRNYFAQIDLADGLTDYTISVNNRIRSIIVNEAATTMWIGGDFTGDTRNKLQKLNLVDDNWSLDTTWVLRAQVGDESDSSYDSSEGDVYSMVKLDNTIYLAGSFTHINSDDVNYERNFLVAVDANSGLLSSWQPIVSNPVRSLFVANNQIIAGGEFIDGIIAFDSEGNAVTTWSPSVNGTVHTINSTTDGVFAGGTFTSSKTTPRSNLVALNADGSLKTDWNVGTENTNEGSDNFVKVLALNNQNLYIGGSFNKLDGEERNSLGAIDTATGELIESFNSSVDLVVVNALIINDQIIYLGGKSDTDSVDVIALNLQSGVLVYGTSFAGDEENSINCLASYDNLLYVGGSFTITIPGSNGITRNNVYALDMSTTIPTITDWNPNVDGPVNSIVAEPEGMLVYIGGSFDQVKGEARTNFAAITTDGTLVDSNPIPGTVNKLLLVGENRYVGSENQLTILDALSQLVDVIDMDGSVSALHYNVIDNKLHVGGSFTGGYTTFTLEPSM